MGWKQHLQDVRELWMAQHFKHTELIYLGVLRSVKETPWKSCWKLWRTRCNECQAVHMNPACAMCGGISFQISEQENFQHEELLRNARVSQGAVHTCFSREATSIPNFDAFSCFFCLKSRRYTACGVWPLFLLLLWLLFQNSRLVCHFCRGASFLSWNVS